MRAMQKLPRALATLAWAAILLAPARAGTVSARQESSLRIVAVGDIHGAAHELQAILRAAGLIGSGRTLGGRTNEVRPDGRLPGPRPRRAAGARPPDAARIAGPERQGEYRTSCWATTKS